MRIAVLHFSHETVTFLRNEKGRQKCRPLRF
jgi:hypothetical protein